MNDAKTERSLEEQVTDLRKRLDYLVVLGVGILLGWALGNKL